MKTRILITLLPVLLLSSCSGLNRMMSPGPAAPQKVPMGALGSPQLNEFDILRLSMMQRMANGNKGGEQ